MYNILQLNLLYKKTFRAQILKLRFKCGNIFSKKFHLFLCIKNELYSTIFQHNSTCVILEQNTVYANDIYLLTYELMWIKPYIHFYSLKNRISIR